MSSATPKKAAPAKKKKKKGAGRVNPKKHKPFKGKFAREKRLPDYFPSDRDEPIFPSTARVRKALDIFERSRILPDLEQRFREHPGAKSALTIKALLVAALIAALEHSTYIRSDITAVLAGLNKKSQAMLGLLCDNLKDAEPISYNVVVDQLQRLEEVLEQGWIAELEQVWDTENEQGRKAAAWRDFDWLIFNAIKATIPREVAEEGEAIAMDATSAQAWEAVREYAVESKARAAQADPFHEDHDRYKDVEFGADGRVVRGVKGDARAIRQSGTNKRNPRMMSGFYHYYSVLTRRLDYYGDPDKIEVGEHVPNYITAFRVSTTESPEAGVALYDESAKILGGSLQVHADMGFTKYIGRFLAPLRRRGADSIHRHSVTEIKHPQKAYLGKKKRELWYYCGQLYPGWLEESELLPPDNADRDQLETHFKRLAAMAYTRNSKLPGGMTQIECPQCSGRITSNRRTRRANVKTKPEPDHLVAETVVDENGELLYCCESSTILINAEEARHFQLPPFGTPANRIARGFRNPAEGAYSKVKNRHGLLVGWCRILHLAAQKLGGLMLVLAHNMKIGRPKPPPKAKPEYGTTTDTPTPETDAETDTPEPPQAPP